MEKENLILGKTFDEIANKYFDSPYIRDAYSRNEIGLLKEGFKEGLAYLFPLYDNSEKLVRLYEKLEKIT